MCRDQTQHKRPKKLRFSRTCCPDTQTVRPHSVLSGFLEVEFDRLTVGTDTDRHPQSITSLARQPRMLRVEPRSVSDAQHLTPRATPCRRPPNRQRSVKQHGTAPSVGRRSGGSRGDGISGATFDAGTTDRAHLIGSDHQTQTTTGRQRRLEPHRSRIVTDTGPAPSTDPNRLPAIRRRRQRRHAAHLTMGARFARSGLASKVVHPEHLPTQDRSRTPSAPRPPRHMPPGAACAATT